MNWDKLKRNIGYKVQLVPVACHLDPAGDILPSRGEDWTIASSGADFLEIDAGSGHLYRLGKDHVHHYTSDAHGSVDGTHYGFLTLNVQLFIQELVFALCQTHGLALQSIHRLPIRLRERESISFPKSNAVFGVRFRFSTAACSTTA